jgi:hypothetical protein
VIYLVDLPGTEVAVSRNNALWALYREPDARSRDKYNAAKSDRSSLSADVPADST